MKLQKYSEQTVIEEAKLFLSGNTLHTISSIILCIPLSTVSWHLLKPLRYIDNHLWVQVRNILDKRAKDPERRAAYESTHQQG